MENGAKVSATIRGELIVLELSRSVSRIGLTLEGWDALRRAGDDLAAALKVRQEQSVSEQEKM